MLAVPTIPGKSLASLQVVAVVGMIIDHATRGLQKDFPGLLLGVFGFTLPVMCFCVSVGYSQTKNVKLYLIRLGLCGLSAQLFWGFSGLGGDDYNDVLGLFMGLWGLVVIGRWGWPWGVGVFAASLFMGLWPHVLMIYGAYILLNQSMVFGAWVVSFGLLFVYHDLRFFAWVLAGVLLMYWDRVGFQLTKPGRLLYWVYPSHLMGLGVVRSLVGVL